MISYDFFQLDNGLEVYVHEDSSTPLAAINILYDVGSRDEESTKTGFAHLFEHLMFGGSKNIENFDTELQRVGGENNAFTCPDYTSYYCTLPSNNIETAFWLESDRMLSLSFNPKVLEVQRSVVIEEFKQRYLNQPYGDAMLHFRPLAYKKHPYQWATIGKEIKHIEDATMDDVKRFFKKYYCPANAKLIVGGNVKTENIKKLCDKWFSTIPSGKKNIRKLPKEPIQEKERKLELIREVNNDALYLGFHMEKRLSPTYHATDLLSDILGRDSSSRLHQELVKKENIFNSIGAYVMGSAEPGLFMISGKIHQDRTLDEAVENIWNIIENLKNTISENELKKVKNQALSSIAFSRIELMDKVMALANGVIIGDADLANREMDDIKKIALDEVRESANTILKKDNACTLFYKSSKNNEIEK